MTNPHRYILVYSNDDGTTQSIRTWTLEEARRRLATLQHADSSRGTWTIHELNGPPPPEAA